MTVKPAMKASECSRTRTRSATGLVLPEQGTEEGHGRLAVPLARSQGEGVEIAAPVDDEGGRHRAGAVELGDLHLRVEPDGIAESGLVDERLDHFRSLSVHAERDDDEPVLLVAPPEPLHGLHLFLARCTP